MKSEPRVFASNWVALAFYLAAVLLAVLVYSSALHGPMVLDDYPTLGPLLALPGLPQDWSYYVMSPTGPLGRPLSMLSFLANLAWNGPELAAWKATNLALHCVVGLLIFDFTRRLLSQCLAVKHWAPLSAAFLAALWLLHPMHPSTVLYTVQRMTILSTLFTVSGIDLYLVGRLQAQDSRAARCAMGVAYLVCTALAALAKEIGLLLPGYLLILELTLLSGTGRSSLQAYGRRLALAFCIVPFLGGAIYCVVHAEQMLFAPNLLRGWTTTERFLTETRIVVRYLGQALIPNRQMFGFFHDDIALSRGILTPLSTATSVLLLTTIGVSALFFRRRAPLFACGVLWFYNSLLLESTIFPLELMFEHRNYFASFGVLLAITGVIAAASTIRDPRILPVSGVAVLLLFASVTASIVGDWRDEASLFASSYRLHPQSANAVSSVAEFLTGRQQYSQALVVLAQVPVTGARLQEAYVRCRRDGHVLDGELSALLFDLEPAMSMYATTGLVELAKLSLDKACAISANKMLELLSAALRRSNMYARNRFLLHFYSAHLQWQLAHTHLALDSLDAAHRADVSDPMPLFLRSEWLNQLGRREEGISALVQGRAIANQSGKDYAEIIAAVDALYSLPIRVTPKT